jgi:uncharacterized membrane protein YkvA (DUF1232 family)
MNIAEKAHDQIAAVVPAAREPVRQPLAEKLKAPIRRFLKELRVMRRALAHPLVPWYAKAVVGLSMLYVLSPIQIIPNFIPVIGQMDDVLVVSLAIKMLRKCVPPVVLEECRTDPPKLVKAVVPVKQAVR